MPCGTFGSTLKSNSSPMVFIAGGIGITPLMSMLETQIMFKSTNEIIFVHCVKTEAEHTFAQKVEKMAEKNSNLTSYAFYSRSNGKIIDDLKSTKIFHKRFQLEDLHEIIGSLIESEFYICGPESFLKYVLASLEKMNISKNKIFYEYFGPQLQ